MRRQVGYTATGLYIKKRYDGTSILDLLLQELTAQVYDMENEHLVS
jgi:hypothetical protein